MKPLKSLKLSCAMMQKRICFAIIFSVLFFIPTVVPAQVVTGSFEFEGKMRDYVVFLPQNYDGVSNMPLVLNLHGNYPGFDGKWQMEWTLMNTVADTAGFIVVYPTGIFQDGTNGCWYFGVTDPTNGVGFITALLDTLNILYRINNDQIYACGHSGGGAMSSKLACELNHRIAAIANEGGGITSGIAEKVNIKRPMPFLSIHGTADRNNPYNTGVPNYNLLSAEEVVSFWIDHNVCSNPDTSEIPDINPSDGCTVEKITYTNTGANTKVVFYKVINGGHTWPGSAYDIPSVGNTNRDISASEEIWNFFKHYELSKLSFPQHDMTVRTFPTYVNTVPILVNNFKPGVIVKNGGLK
ncbi:MAG: hypothetical protein JSW07_01425, partial [bacterium]